MFQQIDSLLLVIEICLTLIVGIYIISRNPHRPASVSAGVTFLLVSVCLLSIVIATNISAIPMAQLILKCGFLLSLIIQPLWFYTTINYLGLSGTIKTWSGHMLKLLIVGLLVVGVLIWQTDLVVVTSPITRVLFPGDVLPFYLIYVLIPALPTSWLFHHYYRTIVHNISDTRFKVYFVQTAISSLTIVLMAMSYFLDTSYLFKLGSSELFVLKSFAHNLLVFTMIMELVAISRYDLFVEQVIIDIKDLLSKSLVIVLLISIYALVFFNLRYSWGDEISFVVLVLFMVVSLIGQDWIVAGFKKAYSSSSGEIEISKDDIIYVLKNWERDDLLAESPLLKMGVVLDYTYEFQTDKIETLRILIRKTLDKLKPQSMQVRTRKLIKYEILRMIVEEGATESRIMWDLGFQQMAAAKKIQTEPRYAVKSHSEYSSNSVMSFRRLKNEAIEDLQRQILDQLS